jgi:hypothetical protein
MKNILKPSTIQKIQHEKSGETLYFVNQKQESKEIFDYYLLTENVNANQFVEYSFCNYFIKEWKINKI